MEIVTEQSSIATKGGSEVLDVTSHVASLLAKHSLREGNATVFVTGSTAAVTTTEFEPGLRRDIPEALNRIAPEGVRYHHDETWHDGNGHSHVRAALLGPSLTVPFSNGELLLGTWQQIVLIDSDNRPRQRIIIVQLIGK
ncbi:MAG: secondary thiamine-phosphate synthase enzyme YjbQ [Bacteroidota bacterium]